jgi:hypothetical protein
MGSIYQGFMAAKRCIAAHPDWTDEQVAESCGIHRLEVDQTITVARREHEIDRPGPPRVLTTYDGGPGG